MAGVPDPRLEGRNGAIWADYIAGRNQEWLAAKYGLSQQRVSQIVQEVRDKLPHESKDEWRSRCLEALLEVHAGLTDIVRAERPPAFHAGDILTDRDGNDLKDYSAYFSAVAHLDKLQTRMARLLGLDAPVAIEHAGDLKVTVEGVDLDQLS